jgi:hypothetical protein
MILINPGLIQIYNFIPILSKLPGDLVFLAKAKDGDYHQEMNGPTFLNWYENRLMPALISSSVIVLDNASYHNIKTGETETITLELKTKSHLSIKPSRLPACKTINLLPFPQGIFGASKPSTGNHM